MISRIGFLVFFVALNSFSQSTKLEVLESSEFREQVRTKEIVAMHSSSNDERGIIRFSSNRYLTFDVFGKNLEPIFTQVIEIQKKEVPVTSLYFKDQIKVITLASPKKRERQVYCYVFDLNKKTYSKTLLFEKVLEKNQSLFSGKNKRQTSFAKSPNGKFLVMLTDNIKKTSNSFTAHVYNGETLDLVFKKTYEREVDRYFLSNDLGIDDTANVYVIGKQFFKGRSDKQRNAANYEFVVNKITKNDVQTAVIKLEGEFVSSLSFGEIKEKVLLVGFYSDSNSSRIKGGCSFNLALDDLSLLDKSKNELPADVYEGIYGYRKAKDKKGKELNNFYIDYVLEDTDNNIYLVSEEFYVTTHYMYNGVNGGGTTTTTFHYDDILVLKFDGNGELVWGRSIFKRSNAPSYNVFLLEDQLHLILNSGKNFKEKDDGRTKVSKGWFESSSLYDIVFDENGKVSYDKIQDNKGQEYYLPAYGTFTSDDSFIMINKGRTTSTNRKLMLLR